MDHALLHPLQRLSFKYRALTELRRRREELETRGLTAFDPEEGSERRRQFHALASEFPGALRELDATPATGLSWRALAVDQAIADLKEGRGLSSGDAWMEWMSTFHGLLREALEVKRWLASRRLHMDPLSPADLQAFVDWRSQRPRTAIDGAQARKVIEEHLRPPGGRIQAYVWRELEKRFGVPGREMETVLFGHASVVHDRG